MKRLGFIAVGVIAVVLCCTLCACTSSAPIVGEYKLVNAELSNGTVRKSYNVGDDTLVTEYSVTLNVKSNYKWTLNINLPEVGEHEDGVWAEDDGVYEFKEDRRDEEKIPVQFIGDDTVILSIREDGYLMRITLQKTK